MVDDIDRKLIIELQRDGRVSHAKLAQKLGINVATVSKRIERMLKEDVITIRALPNPFKMGYTANAFITMDVDLTKIDEVCAKLASNLNVNMICTAFGRFDVLLIVNFSSWEMIRDFVRGELAQIDGVNKIETYFIDEIKKRYQGIFDDDSSLQVPASLDEIDRRLIVELTNDGSISYSDLSQKFGTSLSTVSRRVAQLQKKNIISIRGIPNPTKLDLMASAFITLNANHSKIEHICNELAQDTHVFFVMTLFTGFDILIGSHFSSPEILNEFIVNKIAHIEGVKNVETFVRAEIKKRYYGWFLEDSTSKT